MKTFSKAILLSILILALASCNTFAPPPTATPTSTATSLPTATNTPTPTNTPTKTPVPPTETPSVPVLPIPSGKPVSEWEGIPIMPNAIAGQGDSKGYSFTVNASADEIQQFYEKELGKLGWKVFASGQGTTSVILLFFMKETSVMTVSIFPQPDGIMLVMIVK